MHSVLVPQLRRPALWEDMSDGREVWEALDLPKFPHAVMQHDCFGSIADIERDVSLGPELTSGTDVSALKAPNAHPRCRTLQRAERLGPPERASHEPACGGNVA
jgi:hypothetical protein